MRKKLRSARGETLVELLCAILIGSLSVALLFSMVMASVHMDRSAEAADESFHKSLSAAEGRGTAIISTAKVTVENKNTAILAPAVEPSVTFYGGQDAISYALNKEAP